mgnify:CR=1 FL=1
MLFKNAVQKIHIYAYDSTTGAPKTGDQANITAYVSLDGTANAVDDTNPDQVDATNMPGVYAFNLTAADTNCDSFALYAKSITANIRIEPIIGFTTAGAVPAAVAGAAGGLLTAGSNAATTFATLTCTGALTISDGIVVTCSTDSKSALKLTGGATAGVGFEIIGTGAPGLKTTGGSASAGFLATGGATSGIGISAVGTGSGAGLKATGGATGHGLWGLGTGGAGIYALTGTGAAANNWYALHCVGVGTTESGGIKGVATTDGEGIEGLGANNGHGLYAVGAGTGDGCACLGDAFTDQLGAMP